MPSQLVLIEEHHEAFYVWHSARARGWVPREPLPLLHVDQHADLALPTLRRPLESLSTLPATAGFVYSELRIDTFLYPAVYQGLFSALYWFRTAHRQAAGGWRRMRVTARDPERLRFAVQTAAALGPLPDGGGFIEYAPMTIADPLPSGMACVLDIDLDYFCWNEEPEWRDLSIEVTPGEYQRFRRDRYHFLRLSPNSQAAAFERDGRLYLSFQHAERAAPPATPQPVVASRIDKFAAYLVRHRLRPLLITVCRSQHSGYVQSANVEFVQQRLLERLAEACPYRAHRIAELMDADRQAERACPAGIREGSPC